MLGYDLVPAPPQGAAVLVLHGLGDSRHGWKPLAGELDLPGLGWIFAEAPDPYGGGWSWFDLQLPDLRPQGADVRRSRALLRELLEHLERDRGLPCERLHLLGFSQGCLMALDLALRHPRPFASVSALSGWVAFLDEYPGAFGAAARAQRILMTHGLHDPVVPIEAVRPQARHLQALGLALDWREYGKAHHLDPEEELPALRAHIAQPLPKPSRPG